ncbi:hypothetical protein ACJW31_06G004800 [Castanea mollissima]
MMGQCIDLDSQLFETATLFITVLVVAFLLQEGTSNYFKGLMLILCYLIVAASFLYMKILLKEMITNQKHSQRSY